MTAATSPTPRLTAVSAGSVRPQFAKIYSVIEEKVEDERRQRDNAASQLRGARRRVRVLVAILLLIVLFVGANVSATGYLSAALFESAKELHAVRSNRTARGEANDPTAGARLKDNSGDVVATREVMSKVPSLRRRSSRPSSSPTSSSSASRSRTLTRRSRCRRRYRSTRRSASTRRTSSSKA